ncbi:hypothetical protein evm_008521 [Chilo suppressalis]|nr:hypothetical protein evm_008521 [Chilo suppressalis]
MLLYVLVLLLALTWVYLKWLSVKRYWAERGVVHEKPHPLLGSFTFLQKVNPAIWMRKIYDRFPKEPYVGIWVFWRPGIIVNSPELARRILVKDFDCFRNRLAGTDTGKVDPIGGLNIFTLNNLYVDYTTDVIGTSSFGIKLDTVLTGSSPLRSITATFMHYGALRGLAWCSIFYLPELAKVFRFNLFPKSSVAYFRRVFKQIVAQRGGYNGKSEENDLLDALRKIKYDSDNNGEVMDEDLVIAQAAVFLQAGFDTSASALTFLTYELAYKPEIQEKVYQELLQAKKALGDKEFDATVLSELIYFNCVIKETLRKYPPMGWLDRVAEKTYRIDDKLTIAKGTSVYVNSMGMQHDPDYYPDPDRFDPDRFLPENDDGSRPYMPFGEGPRICIGMRFAHRTIWYAASQILLNYHLQPMPGTKTPVRCEVDHRGLILAPGKETYVKFVPRS